MASTSAQHEGNADANANANVNASASRSTSGGPTTTRAPRAETMRVREVFRFLEPWEKVIQPTALSQPAANDPKDRSEDKAERNRTPVGCDDTALAAFAQLGALRLKAQRCMVSLLGRDHEFVLAESTRTLSLQSDVVHGKTDELWLGTTSFPRNDGLSCLAIEHWRKTRDIRPPPPDAEHFFTDGLTSHYYIISDMRQHENLHDRLLYKYGKGMRFYCSVPIRTPSGTVLGSYTVIDDRPRFGLSAPELEFLEDLADTVMSHLETKRAMLQRQRGDRLIKGMALFSDGKSSLRDWWLANYSRQERGEGQRRRKRSLSDDQVRNDRADEEFGMTYRAQDLDNRGRLTPARGGADKEELAEEHVEVHDMAEQNPEPEVAVDDHEPETGPITTSTLDQATKESRVSTNEQTSTPLSLAPPGHLPTRKAEGFNLITETEKVFARASNLIRESLNAEGVIFLDADFSRPKQDERGRYKKADAERSSSATESETEAVPSPEPIAVDSDADDDGREAVHDIKSVKNAETTSATCSLLGFSSKVRSSLRGFTPSQNYSSLPKHFLEKLLRRHPRGKIFNYYNGQSLLSSSGTEGGDSAGSSLESGNPSADPKHKAKRRKTKEAQEAATLAALVTDPRSVAFLPLWDGRRERYRAGVLVWNASPNRFLDLEEDMTYLASFGNSLMVELARLDAIAADYAKSTFISSVSHELRSPLHGVLAGVEFLQDSDLNTYQQEMASTVGMAGKTLLDTINNILDFTKINAFTDVQRRDRKERDLTRHIAFKTADMGEVGVTDTVDLAALTENVVETVVAARLLQASSSYKIKKLNRSNTDGPLDVPTIVSPGGDPEEDDDMVAVVLDMTKQTNWGVHISPGSWTRIITNILGNALKYTKKGLVTIKLRSRNNSAGKPEVVLTVEDTGQGISAEYLKHHVFTPFMQENSHSVGIGLGLSIVKQIVEELGGHVDIVSEVGRGTKVIVNMTVGFASEDPSVSDPSLTEIQSVYNDLGRSLNLAFPTTVGRSEHHRRERHFKSIVSKTCSDWCFSSHMDTKNVHESTDADIIILTEGEYEQWEETSGFSSYRPRTGVNKKYERPMIVLSSSKDFVARGADPAASRGGIFFVQQPFGPRKMARALKQAWNKRNSIDRGPLSTLKTSRLNDSRSTISTRNHQPSPSRNGYQSATSLTRNDSADNTDESSFPDDSDMSPAPPTQQSQQSDSFYSPVQTTPRAGGKVLLVEDNEINMKLLIAAMTKLNRAFQMAENGLEAVQRYAATPHAFSLILMDISMPVMDGNVATETIRALEKKNKWRKCHIIAITGVASAEARTRAFACGVDTFMTKPASMVKLKNIISELEL